MQTHTRRERLFALLIIIVIVVIVIIIIFLFFLRLLLLLLLQVGQAFCLFRCQFGVRTKSNVFSFFGGLSCKSEERNREKQRKEEKESRSVRNDKESDRERIDKHRQTNRETQTERQRDREAQTERQRGTDRETVRHNQRDRDREKQTDRRTHFVFIINNFIDSIVGDHSRDGGHTLRDQGQTVSRYLRGERRRKREGTRTTAKRKRIKG
jgi:hypothetical protein